MSGVLIHLCMRQKGRGGPSSPHGPRLPFPAEPGHRIGAAHHCFSFLQVSPAPLTAGGPRRSTAPLSEAQLSLPPHLSNRGKGDYPAQPELSVLFLLTLFPFLHRSFYLSQDTFARNARLPGMAAHPFMAALYGPHPWGI